MKRCTKCNELKELTEFHKNSKSKDGCQYQCKKCSIKAALIIGKKNKDKINARRRERRANDPEYKIRISNMKKNLYWKNREAHLLIQAKQAFKKRGIECTIKITDIVIPKYCPVLNVLLDKGRYAPSLDRIDNSKGYIPGNVWVISKVANIMKNDGSIQELLTFCENLPKYLKNMI